MPHIDVPRPATLCVSTGGAHGAVRPPPGRHGVWVTLLGPRGGGICRTRAVGAMRLQEWIAAVSQGEIPGNVSVQV